MQDFFPEVFQHGNLSEVTWDHAVNSKQLLTDALASKYFIIYNKTRKIYHHKLIF